MIVNSVKQKLSAGHAVIGIETWLRDPRLIDLVGQAGFDFVHIENEHVGRGWESVELMIRAALAAGLTPLFRTEQCFEGRPPMNQIAKAIKCGAQIIMVPDVEDAETARRVVDAVKLPPQGRRGMSTADLGVGRVIDGATLDIGDFAERINAETMVWLILESRKAIDNADEIAAVVGVDALGFGPQDFAVSSGISSVRDPLVPHARGVVRDAAARHGKHFWWSTVEAGSFREAREDGIQICLLGADIVHWNRLLQSLVEQARG